MAAICLAPMYLVVHILFVISNKATVLDKAPYGSKMWFEPVYGVLCISPSIEVVGQFCYYYYSQCGVLHSVENSVDCRSTLPPLQSILCSRYSDLKGPPSCILEKAVW